MCSLLLESPTSGFYTCTCPSPNRLQSDSHTSSSQPQTPSLDIHIYTFSDSVFLRTFAGCMASSCTHTRCARQESIPLSFPWDLAQSTGFWPGTFCCEVLRNVNNCINFLEKTDEINYNLSTKQSQQAWKSPRLLPTNISTGTITNPRNKIMIQWNSEQINCGLKISFFYKIFLKANSF